MGDVLRAPEWQGIGVLITVAIAVLTWWTARRSRQHDVPETTPPASDGGGAARLGRKLRASPNVTTRLGGALLVLMASYVLYTSVFAVLAFAYEAESKMTLLSSGFAIFAAPPGFLALVMRWPFVGGFLGGAVPLSVFALHTVSNPSYLAQGEYSSTPLALFVLAFLFGGMIGALTAGPMVIAARSLGVPLPRNYQRSQPVDA